MNYFKGYKKKGRCVGAPGVFGSFVPGYIKGSLSFSLGSQIVSNPEFGMIGQQGAQGLALGASFLPPIAMIGVGGYTVKQLRKLQSYSRRK